MKLLFLFYITLFNCVCLFAQQGEVYHKTQFNKKHGLSQDGIHSLFQSSSGLIWVGTQDGLNRFNGHNFKSIAITGMDKFIIAITEDAKGNIWFCSRDRLAYYHPQQEQVIITNARWKDYPSYARFIKEGEQLYLFTGETLVKCETQETKHQSLPYDDIIQTQEVYWFIKNGSFTCSKKLWGFQPTKQLNQGPYSIPYQLGGKQLIVQLKDSLFAYDFGLNRRFIGINKDKVIQANWIQENLFITLSTQNLALQKEVAIPIAKAQSSTFNVLLNPTHHSYFIGSTGEGLLKLKLLPRVQLTADDSKNMRGLCAALCLTESGLWLKMADSYHLINAQKQFILFKQNQLFQRKGILGMKKLKDGTYCAYGKKGILILTPSFEVKYDLPEPIAGISFYHASPTKEGVLLASGYGAYIWQQRRPNDLQKLPYSNGFCTSTLYLENKNQYIISSLKELMVYDINGRKTHSFLKPDREGDKAIFPSVLVQTDKGIYVGTLGNGIKFLPYNFDTVMPITAEGEHIFGMIQKGAYLWFSSINGVFRLAIESNRVEQILFKEELPGELYQNSYEIGSNGLVMFGGTEGWIALDENKISSQNSKLYTESWFIGTQKGLDINRENAEGIFHLESSEKDIRLQVGIITSNPEAFGLRYKLAGYDNQWQPLSTEFPLINYTNLPYGNLDLEVELYGLLNPNVVLSNLRVSFYHAVPFYLTWWFLSIVFVALVSLVIVVVRYISQRKLKQQLEEAHRLQLIHAEKTIISRELHDNVGAQVTYLTKSMENLAFTYQKEGKNELAVIFRQMANQSRAVMNHLRDSIWAVRTEKMYGSEMFMRLVNFCQKSNEHSGIEMKVENLMTTDFELNPQVGLNLFRILQEAVTNAVKHSACTQILIRMHQAEELVIFEVSDNGKGIPANATSGYGLENMRVRAKESSLQLDFELPDTGGTSVRVGYKLNKSNDV